MKTLILSRSDVEKLVNMRQVVKRVEAAFKDYALGKAHMPPKVYLDLKKFNGDFRAMPAFCESLSSCGVKWVNVHPDNRKRNLPTVMAVVILSDPKTGFPLAIMDGTYLTSLRTGASGAVAAKYLARKDARTVALIGCGAQAKTQLMALAAVCKIQKVFVWGKKKSEAQQFIRRMKPANFDLQVEDSVREAVAEADIIITITPSRKPLVKLQWLKKGVHINAIGADAKGKQELDFAILKKAKLVIDDWPQASHSGEINMAVSRKIITRKNIYVDIGSIAAGRKKGRVNSSEITVFDSTGLAIQDVAVAQLIYQSARRKKTGRLIQLI